VALVQRRSLLLGAAGFWVVARGVSAAPTDLLSAWLAWQRGNLIALQTKLRVLSTDCDELLRRPRAVALRRCQTGLLAIELKLARMAPVFAAGEPPLQAGAAAFKVAIDGLVEPLFAYARTDPISQRLATEFVDRGGGNRRLRNSLRGRLLVAEQRIVASLQTVTQPDASAAAVAQRLLRLLQSELNSDREVQERVASFRNVYFFHSPDFSLPAEPTLSSFLRATQPKTEGQIQLAFARFAASRTEELTAARVDLVSLLDRAVAEVAGQVIGMGLAARDAARI
jgi:hypothetical protein